MVFWRGRKAEERRLAEARRELETAWRQLEDDRRRLVMTVGHELRTPLTVIQGVVHTLATHWDRLSESERLDMFDAIATNAASLDATILHFIDVGQLERGETALHLTEVWLPTMIESVLAQLAPVVTGYPVYLSLDAKVVWADQEALARMLALLLENAVRFSALATPIYIRAKQVDDSVEIAVVDRGMGIAPRHLPHVFEPFWRANTEESGISRGAGLGLSIVKELTELHGGSVRVLSSQGRGSAFHLRLPRRAGATTDQPPAHRVG